MLNTILIWVLVLTSPIWLPVMIITFMMVGYYVYYRFVRKMEIDVIKTDFKKEKILKRLFIDFPNRFMLDLFERDAEAFKEHGLHMFCGEQGSGKTTSVVHLLMQLQSKYPRLKVRTNMNYSMQDAPINHWKDLVQNDNGEYGQVEVLDEIQTWFSSLQSKDFPYEMITEISQQRKQRKMLIGTAQVFSRIAKPIREQTTLVYLPLTLFGCLTWVRVSKPHFWDDEKQQFKRFIRHYFFVHNEELRNAFDTYAKIEKYKAEGFKDDNLRVGNFGS